MGVACGASDSGGRGFVRAPSASLATGSPQPPQLDRLCVCGGQRKAMQAPGRDDDEGSDSMVGGAGSRSGPGDPMGPGDGDSTGAESAAAGEDPQVDRASLDSGPAREASDSSGDLGSEMQEFTLTVPFLSDVDAEVALRFLMPGAISYHGMVLWELSVTGNELFIRLTAEDSELLQISTFSMLIQLLIVVRIMQHIVLPVVADLEPKRAD